MSEFAISADWSEQQRSETFLARRTNLLKFCLNLIGFVALSRVVSGAKLANVCSCSRAMLDIQGSHHRALLTMIIMRIEFTLSRLKQGFDSPRERQQIQALSCPPAAFVEYWLNKTLVNSSERVRNLLPILANQPRRDASLWLAHSRKISPLPLVSGNIQTAADVRCRTPAPSDVRIDVARRTANSHIKLCANRRAT